MSSESAVTAVIINYKTSELARRAALSFQKHYPAVPLLLIDNGSHDNSLNLLNEFKQRSPEHTEIILNSSNLHHGPAMDQALHNARTSYVLFLDSDCEIHTGGFLEMMIARLEQHAHHYAVGKRVFMNKRGFDTSEDKTAIPYIRPMFMLLKRELYTRLPSFRHHGSPCLANMAEAQQQGLLVLDFPVNEYVIHQGRGTAGKYGYDLGWRGKFNYVLNKLGL